MTGGWKSEKRNGEWGQGIRVARHIYAMDHHGQACVSMPCPEKVSSRTRHPKKGSIGRTIALCAHFLRKGRTALTVYRVSYTHTTVHGHLRLAQQRR